MNMKNQKDWDQLRTAYRPHTPALDTAAIMDAVRREAAAHPLRRADAVAVAAIPTWVCALAASLAILATAGVVGRSFTIADRQISQAWMQSVQLEEFEQTFLDVPESEPGL